MSNIFLNTLSILIVLYIVFHTIKNVVFANKLEKRNLSIENINNFSVSYKYDFSLLERPAFLRRPDFWDKSLFQYVIQAMNENEFKLLVKSLESHGNSNKISDRLEMLKYFQKLDDDKNQELINKAKLILNKTFANTGSYATGV
jgi:hypothetical protein